MPVPPEDLVVLTCTAVMIPWPTCSLMCWHGKHRFLGLNRRHQQRIEGFEKDVQRVSLLPTILLRAIGQCGLVCIPSARAPLRIPHRPQERMSPHAATGAAGSFKDQRAAARPACAYTKILKTARTIADLEGADKIRTEHITETIQYRSLDRNLWA